MPGHYLFVIDNLSTGGAQRQLVNLATGLKQRGNQIDFFCYTPGDLLAKPLLDASIPVHWQIKRGRYSFETILALRKLIHDTPFDLVLSFLTTPNFYSLAAGRLSGKRHIPIIVSERFCDLPSTISRSERFARLFYRFADRVVTNSHHQRENLFRLYPELRNRLSTIYNGYDLGTFTPPAREPFNEPLRILAIASVSPYKNGLCLIEALQILREKYGLTPCVDWIGQRLRVGDRQRYINEMEHQISAYGLEQQWQWLDQRSDIVQQLQEHDALVHPSFGEGLPNVVCEALACGRPVIVSNVLDHSRLVLDKINGYLFDVQQPADLADKIYQFSRLDAQKRREMGLAGRQFAETSLSLDRFVCDYEQLFESVLDH